MRRSSSSLLLVAATALLVTCWLTAETTGSADVGKSGGWRPWQYRKTPESDGIDRQSNTPSSPHQENPRQKQNQAQYQQPQPQHHQQPQQQQQPQPQHQQQPQPHQHQQPQHQQQKLEQQPQHQPQHHNQQRQHHANRRQHHQPAHPNRLSSHRMRHHRQRHNKHNMNRNSLSGNSTSNTNRSHRGQMYNRKRTYRNPNDPRRNPQRNPNRNPNFTRNRELTRSLRLPNRNHNSNRDPVSPNRLRVTVNRNQAHNGRRYNQHTPVSRNRDQNVNRNTILETPNNDASTPNDRRPPVKVAEDTTNFEERNEIHTHSEASALVDRAPAPARAADRTNANYVDTTVIDSIASEVVTAKADSVKTLYNYVCPPDFLRLGNGCYYMSKDMHSWRSAHFECRARDSELAVIESEWEDNTLKGYLNSQEMTRLNRWLGGIYDWSQEEWMWGSSGDLIGPYRGFLSPTASDTPHSARWTCVYMSPSLNYRWHYTKCTDYMHYICETNFQRELRKI